MKTLMGFVFAGGVATIFNYSIFLLLLTLGWNPSLASALGYVSGIGISYFLNKKFVFSGSQKASFSKYTIAYAFALVLQVLVLNGLLFASIEVRLANAIAIFIVVIVNYFVVKRFVFGPQRG